MKRDEVIRILAQHGDQIAEFGIRRLALFGSVARDRANSRSDVDFLVEFEGPATFDRYIELSFFLEELLGCRVDLVTASSLRASMRPNVEQDAIDVPGLRPVSR